MKINMEGVANAMAEDIRTLVQTVMQSGSAADNRSSIKELRDSVRKDDIVVKASTAGGGAVVEILYDSVLEWDRKPRSGKHLPVSQIKEWASSKGLATDNATINLIRRALWWSGHAGQPLVDVLDTEIERMMDSKWSDMIIDALVAELSEWFRLG